MSGADGETVRASLEPCHAHDTYPAAGCDVCESLDALDRLAARVAEAEKALREIIRLDDEEVEPGFAAGPDYYAGVYKAAEIARSALPLSPEAVQAGGDQNESDADVVSQTVRLPEHPTFEEQGT